MQTNPNIEDVITRLKKGDHIAFEQTFHAYKARLYHFAIRFLKSHELTCDFIHDVFLKVWENRKNLDPKKSFEAYIITICRNMIFNYLKQAARREDIKLEILRNLPSSQNSTENDFYTTEYSRVAKEALDRLPPKRREVFQMCRLEGISYNEAADKLGISRNAIKDHMVKASRFVQNYFQGHQIICLVLFNAFLSLD